MKIDIGLFSGKRAFKLSPLLSALMVLTFVPHAHGGYFDGFACGQPAPAAAGLLLEYTDLPRLLSWYRGTNQRQDFGGVTSDRVSYLFLNGQFYGKVCPIVGQDQINAVLRFFRQELDRIYAEHLDAGAFRHPIERQDDAWVFIEPDLISHRAPILGPPGAGGNPLPRLVRAAHGPRLPNRQRHCPLTSQLQHRGQEFTSTPL